MTCPVCKEGKMVEVKKSYFAQFDNYYVIIKMCHAISVISVVRWCIRKK